MKERAENKMRPIFNLWSRERMRGA